MAQSKRILVFLLGCCLYAPWPSLAADLDIGDRAPEFALPGSDGKTHRLSDYRGTPVVLAWFPKAFTGG